MNIGPVVMQGDPAGIGVSDRFQAKPILDLALLPVHSWQFGRERWKLGIVDTHRGSHNQIASVALPFKYVVVEENTFCGTSVLGEPSNQSALELISQVSSKTPKVWIPAVKT